MGDRLAWDWHGIDLSGVLTDPGDARVVLDGFFQDASYYTPYRDAIRRWFALKPRDLPTPGRTTSPFTSAAATCGRSAPCWRRLGTSTA